MNHSDYQDSQRFLHGAMAPWSTSSVEKLTFEAKEDDMVPCSGCILRVTKLHGSCDPITCETCQAVLQKMMDNTSRRCATKGDKQLEPNGSRKFGTKCYVFLPWDYCG